MSRTIIRRSDLSEAMPEASSETQDATQGADHYKDRLLKFIPAEVISLYVALASMIHASAQPAGQVSTASWFIFYVGLVATPLYLWRVSKVTRLLQLVISTGAFTVWVLAMGGPLAEIAWVKDHPLIVACILPIYTFSIPLVYR